MNGLKMMKNKGVNFFAAEAHGAVKMLKHLVLQLYWSSILAVVFQYREGSLGDIKVFVAYTVLLRLVKMPFELQSMCKFEVLWYLSEILQKLNYMEKRQMKETYSSGDTTIIGKLSVARQPAAQYLAAVYNMLQIASCWWHL